MPHRTGLALVVTFVLGFTAAHFLDRPTAAQPPAPAAAVPANARFWPLTANMNGIAYLVLVDLQTGESFSKPSR